MSELERWEYLEFTDEDRVIELKKLDRTPETIKEDVISIKKWIDKQPHLPNDILDDIRIEKFILLSKGSIEIAKKRVEMYLSLSTLHPEIYEHMIPESDRLQDTLKYMIAIPLPKVTKTQNRIFLFSFIDNYKDHYDPIACFLYIMCMVEVRLKYDYKLGDINVCDLKNVKFSSLSKFTPMMMKTTIQIVQGTFGTRIHKILFVNIPPVIEKIIVLLRSFLAPKIANRVQVCKDVESIYEYIPREIMPIEYGGNEESMFSLRETWNKKILELSPIIKKFRSISIDKNLMPKRLNDEYLGIEGNFRKLDID